MPGDLTNIFGTGSVTPATGLPALQNIFTDNDEFQQRQEEERKRREEERRIKAEQERNMPPAGPEKTTLEKVKAVNEQVGKTVKGLLTPKTFSHLAAGAQRGALALLSDTGQTMSRFLAQDPGGKDLNSVVTNIAAGPVLTPVRQLLGKDRLQRSSQEIQSGVDVVEEAYTTLKPQDDRPMAEKLSDPEYIATNVAETITYMLPSVILGGGTKAATASPKLAGLVGSSAMGLQIFGAAFQEAKTRGASDEEADQRAAVTAVTMAVLEKFGLDKLFSASRIPTKNLALRIAARAGEVTLVENITENLQNVADVYIGKAFGEDRKVQEAIDQIPETTLLTTITSLFMGGAAEVPSVIQGPDGMTAIEDPVPTIPFVDTSVPPPVIPPRRQLVAEDTAETQPDLEPLKAAAQQYDTPEAFIEAVEKGEIPPEYLQALDENVKFKTGDKGFAGFTDLSTTIVEGLKGKTNVSRQYIDDLTKQGNIRQAERNVIHETLSEMEGDKINATEFANAVRTKLLPLERRVADTGGQYENIALADDLRGPVANYSEHIYESPIKTSAGEVHFGGGEVVPENYFAHTRIEDLPEGDTLLFDSNSLDSKPVVGTTRRVIEIQSDLFQKGRLEREAPDFSKNIYDRAKAIATPEEWGNIKSLQDAEKLLRDKGDSLNVAGRYSELEKLEPYRNTWHERVIREEVKRAAQDGKTKLQFPTGETAMKIEGLGSNVQFITMAGADATPADLKVGEALFHGNGDWIITDVLGDGKFKAVSKSVIDRPLRRGESFEQAVKSAPEVSKETFDISGKVDTNNPIYKFYEKTVSKFLKNKFGAQLVTDDQGVTWMEVTVDESLADEPVTAFRGDQGSGIDSPISGKEAKKKVQALLKQHKILATVEVFTKITDAVDSANLLGVMTNNKIGLAEKTAKFAGEHEFTHLVLANLKNIEHFKRFDRQELYNEWRKQANSTAEDLEVEEEIAIEVERYFQTKETTKTGMIRQYLDAAIDFFKKIVRAHSSKDLQAFYKELYSGKGQKNTRLPEKPNKGIGRYTVEETEAGRVLRFPGIAVDAQGIARKYDRSARGADGKFTGSKPVEQPQFRQGKKLDEATIARLMDFYNKTKGIAETKPAVAKKLPERKVAVAREQLPVGEGIEVASRLEARVRGLLDKLPESQINDIGVATYRQMNKKEQISKASQFVTGNPKEALAVLRGQKDAPKGILTNSIYVAMQNLAQGDIELARQLSSLQSTRMGQEISILTEIDPHSPVKVMESIIRIREEVAQKRLGRKKTVAGEKKRIAREIKQSIKAPSRETWSSFISSLEC